MNNPEFGRAKLDFDNFLSSPGNTSTGETTTFNLAPTRGHADRLKDAQILELKARISEKEHHIEKLNAQRRREKIEYEMRLQNDRADFQRRLDRYKEVRAQQQVQANREEDLQEELRACVQELQANKASGAALQKDNLNLMQQLTELKQTQEIHASELELQNTHLEADLNIKTSELESTKQQLNFHKTRLTELHSELVNLEECQNQARSAEIKVKELQEKLSRLEEDAVVTKNMRAYVTKYPELEKENKQLRDEIQMHRDREENVYMLKEQLKGAVVKLERAETKLVQLDQLTTQVGILQGKLKEYEFVDHQGKVRMLHPDEMKQRISDLQVENTKLMDTQGQHTATIHGLESKLQETEQRVNQLRAQLQQEHNAASQNSEHVKRMRRKMMLFAKERDSLKQVLDSYESEMTVNVGQVTSQRTKQLEEISETYQHQLASLEEDLNFKTQRMSELQARCSVLEQQLHASGGPGSAPPVPVSSQVDQQLITSLRKQLSELQTQFEKAVESKEILEARIDQRHMQGEYDPIETKVVHFRMNPADLAQQRRALELAKLKEENESLRKRLQVLEEAGGAVEDLTERVNLQPPTNSKETQELRAELEQARLKNLRLTEVFKRTSRDIRDVLCYQLLGYRFDIPGSNQYRLMNMYAESPNDYLLFQQSSDGEVQMLENEYTRTQAEKIETYLKTYNSIPAFLSALTLDLFQKQTMVVS